VERRKILHCRESFTEEEKTEPKFLNLNVIVFFEVVATVSCDTDKESRRTPRARQGEFARLCQKMLQVFKL
jgi:hypothetical protein